VGTRPTVRWIPVRVLHAHALIVALEQVKQESRKRAKQVRKEIEVAAVEAMIAAGCGSEIAYHPFTGAGLDLVLSARWSERQDKITVEVDVRPTGSPAITVAGPLPAARAGGMNGRGVSRPRW